MPDVFVVMVADRHIDPYPEIYTTLDDAIEGARAAARRHAAHPEVITEEPPPADTLASLLGVEDPNPWLFHIGWSTEGDHAWVVREPIRGNP